MKTPFDLVTIDNKRLLFVMAAAAEYGPHLKGRFNPLMTGVGPVEAAIATTFALANLADRDALPSLVVSLGSAGSATLDQARVYQASSVSYRDMDASAFGFEKGRTPFLDLPAKLPLVHTIFGLPMASLSTGANVVSGGAYGGIDAEMVDMETFAVLRACQRFGVPLIGLRGISDGASEVRHIDDWTAYLDLIDERLGLAVDAVFAAVKTGEI